MAIIKNAVQCKKCGDIIESLHRHDFKRCSCGTCAVDDGHSYLRRLFKESMDDFIDLSVCEKEDVPKKPNNFPSLYSSLTKRLPQSLVNKLLNVGINEECSKNDK